MASTISFPANVAENYEKYMGPLFFEPYAKDLIARLPGNINSVLEIACGTGQVTRFLREHLPKARIVATDLNPGMIEVAKKIVGEQDKIEWSAEDAQELPFDDNTFDAVICQFGLMFLPDKQKGVNEAFSVLKPGGRFIFNTWDSMKNNPVYIIANDVTNSFFPDNPITFWNVPFSMYNPDEMESLMKNAGFTNINVERVFFEGHTDSALDATTGLTLGTPMYLAICERYEKLIPEILKAVSEEIAKKYGETSLTIPMNAWVVEGVK